MARRRRSTWRQDTTTQPVQSDTRTTSTINTRVVDIPTAHVVHDLRRVVLVLLLVFALLATATWLSTKTTLFTSFSDSLYRSLGF